MQRQCKRVLRLYTSRVYTCTTLQYSAVQAAGSRRVDRCNAYLDAQRRQHADAVLNAQVCLDALCNAYNALAQAHACADADYYTHSSADADNVNRPVFACTDALLTALQAQTTRLLSQVPSLQQHVLRNAAGSTYSEDNILPSAVQAVLDVQDSVQAQ